jgi:hypothetical protein
VTFYLNVPSCIQAKITHYVTRMLTVDPAEMALKRLEVAVDVYLMYINEVEVANLDTGRPVRMVKWL